MVKDIKIENVVASATLDCKLPLDEIASRIPGTEWEPEQFPGMVYRIKDPKAASLLFSSGKIVCTGTKSPELATTAVNKIVNSLKKAGIKIKGKPEITVQNIVASASLGKTLKLNEIAFMLPNTEYEPEQFPGLVYRIKKPKVAFLLFSSGRIVCTGGKNMKDVRKALKKLEDELKETGAI